MDISHGIGPSIVFRCGKKNTSDTELRPPKNLGFLVGALESAIETNPRISNEFIHLDRFGAVVHVEPWPQTQPKEVRIYGGFP